MEMIRAFLSLGATAWLLFLSVSCTTSTQSAVKTQESLALSDSAKLTSQTSQAADHTAQHTAEDKVPRIKPADAIKLVKDGSAILIDVRDLNSYETMHAKGALHVAYQDIVDGKFDKLPKDKQLIFYCT